tara:strand:- start:1216 stop:1617 length:402 start_codon:yes stop_codon:yes gene_type:complete
MKKGYKFLIGGVALLGAGYLLYRKFSKGSKEVFSSITQEETNTMGNPETGETPIQEGDVIYPLGDYVNVRYSAVVNNGIINNLMLEVNSPDAIGVVEDILISDGHTWYQVQMNQDLTENTYGFVRSDVVTKTI